MEQNRKRKSISTNINQNYNINSNNGELDVHYSTNESLKIYKICNTSGSTEGGENITLITKGDPKYSYIRLCETNDKHEIIWQTTTKITEFYKSAISFIMPKYEGVHYNDDDITHIIIFIQIIRPKDNVISNQVTYIYKNYNAATTISNPKRMRKNSINNIENATMANDELIFVDTKKHLENKEITNTNTINIEVEQSQERREEQGNKDEDEDEEMLLADAIWSNFFKGNNKQKHKEKEQQQAEEKAVFKYTVKKLQKIVKTKLQKHKIQQTEQTQQIEQIQQTDQIQQTEQIDQNDQTDNEVLQENLLPFEIIELNEHYTNWHPKGHTIFHDAIIHNDFLKLYKLFENYNADFLFGKAINSQRETLLHFACKYNKPELIRPLIGFDCNLCAQDIQSQTPLHLAIQLKHEKCIEIFSDLFHDSSEYKNITAEDFETLLETYNYTGHTVLHTAVLADSRTLVDEMLKFCEQNLIDAGEIEVLGNGNTILHLAVDKKLEEMAKLILKLVPDAHECANYAGLNAYEMDENFADLLQNINRSSNKTTECAVT